MASVALGGAETPMLLLHYGNTSADTKRGKGKRAVAAGVSLPIGTNTATDTAAALILSSRMLDSSENRRRRNSYDPEKITWRIMIIFGMR